MTVLRKFEKLYTMKKHKKIEEFYKKLSLKTFFYNLKATFTNIVNCVADYIN